MPTPDDPSRFWVFAGDQYARIMLDGEGPDGQVNSGPSELDSWTTLGKLASPGEGIDAALPVPDAPNDYWVFAGDQYMKINVTDDAYEDTVIEGPASLRNWTDLN